MTTGAARRHQRFGAARAEARLYDQTITREAAEALRDFNKINDAGRVLHEQWERTGRSAPIEMDAESIDLAAACRADLDGDGRCTPADLRRFLDLRRRGEPVADFNDDGLVATQDVAAFIREYLRCRR
jgi:hypothetical protein